MTTPRLPELGVVYVSPQNKRCMLVPHSRGSAYGLYFRYLSDVQLAGDGFWLTLANFKIMREAARQGPRAHAAPR